MGSRPLAAARRPWPWLVGIGLLSVPAQLAVSARVDLGWDETVYVSQVSRFVPAAFFSAPRARGITWLVAPIASATDSTLALRIYLAVLTGLAIVGAYGVWLRIPALRRSPVIPIAAGLTAACWLTLVYGPEAMPNLWVALGAVAAVGLAVRVRLDPASVGIDTVLATACVAFVCLMRPSDGAILAAALVGVLLLAPRRQWATAAGVVLGAVVGWLPWAIEAIRSYGGVAARLSAASAIQGGALTGFSPDLALRAADGPLLCRPCIRADHPFPVDASALWALGVLLVVLAVVAARRRHQTALVLTPALVAVAMATPYVVGLGYAAPRFLEPALALAAIPVAYALAALPVLAPAQGRALARAVCVVLVLVFVVDQAAIATAVSREERLGRHEYIVAAEMLHRAGVTAPCTVSGPNTAPMGYYTDCSSRAIGGHDQSATPSDLVRLAQTEPVAYLELSTAPPRAPTWAPTWRRIELTHRPRQQNWYAFLSR